VDLLVQTKKRSGSHRGSLDVIADILEASSVGARKTYLMYRCNLSFKQLKYYLDLLLRKKCLCIIPENGNPGLLKITDKGKKFLKVYNGLKAFVK